MLSTYRVLDLTTNYSAIAGAMLADLGADVVAVVRLSRPRSEDGTLSDPALPLLFYRIPATGSDIGVEKDPTLDAVRLVFR